MLRWGMVCLGIVGLLTFGTTSTPALEMAASAGFALENGDVNGDLDLDVSDPIYLLSHLYVGGPAPAPLALCGGWVPEVQNGDANGDGSLDISDSVHLLGALFNGGPPPRGACGDGQGAAGKANPRVIPVQARAFGASYAEWSARWWQWALSLPVGESPFFDEGGCANGASGQSGKVWYLAGVFNESGTAVRECTVPTGKALFFPVINVECSTVEPEPFFGSNEEELRDCALSYSFGNLVAEVDGQAIVGLESFTVVSPLTDVSLPEDNILGVPAGTAQIVSNGVFLMLPPLSAGEHQVRFSGTFTDFDFTLDITYHLTVVGGE